MKNLTLKEKNELLVQAMFQAIANSQAYDISEQDKETSIIMAFYELGITANFDFNV